MRDELTKAVVRRCCAEKALPEISQNQQENNHTGSPYQQGNTSTGTLLRASQNPQELFQLHYSHKSHTTKLYTT